MEDPNPPAESYADPSDVGRAMQRATLYGTLPLWIAPAFADYWFHRKTSIETTSGTHESLIHVLQMTSAGLPTLMALLLEINASVIAVMIGAAITHELFVLWDIAYAEPLRRPSPNEQHMHSFLEVVPLMALTSTLTLHPGQTAALFGRGKEAPRWEFRLKNPPLSRRYTGAFLAAVTLLGIIPYAEEFVRCFRTDGTLLPHTPQPEQATDA